MGFGSQTWPKRDILFKTKFGLIWEEQTVKAKRRREKKRKRKKEKPRTMVWILVWISMIFGMELYGILRFCMVNSLFPNLGFVRISS